MRISGRLYEAIAAALSRRARRDLYHSALEVTIDASRAVIEMAPVWTKTGERGVVVEGPVGSPLLGRSRLFRYEVRCWEGGVIPDASAAVGGPRRVSIDRAVAERVVAAVREFPARTWGRDEAGTGEMWNSNSLVSWLLARAGLDMSAIGPPPGGRAPGWDAGLAVAGRCRDVEHLGFVHPQLRARAVRSPRVRAAPPSGSGTQPSPPAPARPGPTDRSGSRT